ncbi:MAG: hypothetical protein HYZ27_00220, partial [Deltaproteobacteria bacterium]|nr:hypothetical protein [Deltaproteobacteria bacterium]
MARGDPDFSPDLAAFHLERTAERLGEIDFAGRLGVKHQRPRRRTAAVLLACGLWALLLALGLDHGRGRLGALLLHPGAARFSDVPLAGDIQIIYRYPAYTGLGQRVVEGGDGSIAAVVGTEVELSAVADMPVDSAVLRMSSPEGEPMQDIPMQVAGRTLNTRFTVLRDARYHFALVDEDGDAVEERLTHAIRAVLDNYPEITLDAPLVDVELKDDQAVDVLWRAKDDFGVAEVNLVLEVPGKEARRLRLAGPEDTSDRREGRYRWDLRGAAIEPGVEAAFYLEALDNDAVSRPKRGVSARRRLSLFSARRHHQEILASEQEVLDAMVDWLGEELLNPVPALPGAATLRAQSALIERVSRIEAQLAALLTTMRGDKLTRPEYVIAFGNVMEHVSAARRERGALLAQASRPEPPAAAAERLKRRQAGDVTQLEKDIIYLDDLLALQRIDELKETAKDLLAAQRDLQDLLQQYRNSQDPELRAQIEQQIRELRRRMMEMLARMSQIKKSLPGEYRNLEAAAMLELGDQLDRLEEMLRQGDLEGAAAELEQLANMLERMTNALNEAEQE